jgi:hypothetical protein
LSWKPLRAGFVHLLSRAKHHFADGSNYYTTSENLVEVLEKHSNLIVVFTVIGTVGFAFTLGTTPAFTFTVHATEYLAPA